MRAGKSIRERLAELGFTAADPDDRVHDLLDAYAARLEAAAALAGRVTSLETRIEEGYLPNIARHQREGAELNAQLNEFYLALKKVLALAECPYADSTFVYSALRHVANVVREALQLESVAPVVPP